jgi:hypothetical protein
MTYPPGKIKTTNSTLAFYLDETRGQEDKIEEIGLEYGAGVAYRGNTDRGEQVDLIFVNRQPPSKLQEIGSEIFLRLTGVNRIDITL